MTRSSHRQCLRRLIEGQIGDERERGAYVTLTSSKGLESHPDGCGRGGGGGGVGAWAQAAR